MKCLQWTLCLALIGFIRSPLWALGDPPTPLPEAASSSSALIPAAPVSQSDEKLFNINLSPYVAVPVSGNTAKEYNIGGGVEVYMDLKVDKNLLIGLDFGVQDYSINSDYYIQSYQKLTGTTLPSGVSITGDFGVFPVMVMGKHFLNQNKVRPYLLWGAGVAFNSASAVVTYNNQSATISGTETSLLMAEGLGLAFEGDEVEFFLQVRMDMDFTSSNNSDSFTLNAPGTPSTTSKGNLSDDSPTLFLPIQAGLRFF